LKVDKKSTIKITTNVNLDNPINEKSSSKACSIVIERIFTKKNGNDVRKSFVSGLEYFGYGYP